MKKIIFLMLFIFSLSGFAQRISNYKVFLAGKGVAVKFTITKGTSCSGYIIKHSKDSVNFTDVFNYPGICGDTARDESISYFHNDPLFNTDNYYKIELVPVENSVIKKIFVPEILNTSISVYPSPVQTVSDYLTVRIYNTNNTKLSGFIYDQHGKPLKILDLTTTFDLTTITVADLNNGMYFLRLNDGQTSYVSKFFILR
ncbi:MAG: T9SS type A sorting domain-containing protein [Bacteroidetes bacterium]|nr:T9SS type A sorting domain-containing protein [Bacteroidota bacterium]